MITRCDADSPINAPEMIMTVTDSIRSMKKRLRFDIFPDFSRLLPSLEERNVLKRPRLQKPPALHAAQKLRAC